MAANLRGSLTFVFCLLVLFIGVLAYGIALGLDIDCGCLGPATSRSLSTALAIDVGLLILCGLMYLSRHIRSAKPKTLATQLPEYSAKMFEQGSSS